MRHRTLVTGAVMGGIFLSALDVTAVGPAMPRIVGSLGGGELYAFAFSVYAVLSTTTTPVFGRLADRIGRKPVLLSGIGIFLFGSVLCAVAPSMQFFIVARGVQGLGAGALLPVAFTIVGDLYTIEERARIQGYLSGVWGVASVVGPLVGGTLVVTLGWQFIFYLNLPVGLLAAALIHRHFTEKGYPRGGQDLDLVGGTFFSGAVLLLLAGLKLEDPWRVAAFGMAVLFAALFVYRERVAAHPLFDLTLFRIPVYRSANAAGFFAGAVLLGLTAFLPVYVMNVRGGSALDSGLMLTPLSFGWVLAATIGGRLLLRYGFRKVAFPGLLLLAATTAGISQIGETTPWAVTAALMFGTGIGFGLSFTTFLVAVQEEVDADRRGQATSAVQFFRQIGGALGVVALEVVFVSGLSDPGLLEARAGTVTTAAEKAMLMDGFGATFLLAAGFAVVALLAGALTPGNGLFRALELQTRLLLLRFRVVFSSSGARSRAASSGPLLSNPGRGPTSCARMIAMVRMNPGYLHQALYDGDALDTTDFEVACAAASAAQIELTADFSSPLLPLRFALREVNLPSMSAALVQLRYGSRYRVRAGSLEHFYHLNLPLSGATEVRHGDRVAQALAGRRGVVLSPLRSTRFDSVGDFDEITVNIERTVLERHLKTLTGKDVPGPIEFVPEVDLRRNGGARLMTLLPRLIELSRTGASGAESALTEEAVLDTVLLGLDHDHRPLVEAVPSFGGRRLVRRAEEYMEAHAVFPLRIADVARALEVSTRTLQRAFRQFRDCTPQSFLKRLRLDHAMRLLRNDRAVTTVTAAAMNSGFSHLGQFSVDYRRRFRESPSMTLKRSRQAGLSHSR